MKPLSIEESNLIKGGFLSFNAIAGLAALATFLIGVVDGYTRPLKCRR